MSSQSPGWYRGMISRVISSTARSSGPSISLAIRPGSSLRNISFVSTSLGVNRSAEIRIIRSEFRGTTPCHPSQGSLSPTNRSGRNIISMAARLVRYPMTAAMTGMDR